MTVILLVRHGVTEETGKRLYGRKPGIHLSDRGLEQAEALARRLAGLPIEAVYSSPLERSVETAAPIAAALHLRTRTDRGLLEADFGSWTGKTFAQLRRTRRWRRLLAVPSATRPPDGESVAEVQARAVRALDAIRESHPGSAVVVVSHGDPIRLALAHYAGLHIDHFQRLEVAPASISAVAIGEPGPRVLRLNDTGTLDGIAPPPRTGPR